MVIARCKRTHRDERILQGLAERLADLRDECGLEVEDVAEHLGVHKTTVRRWEQAGVSLDTLALLRLARLYQASPEYLLTGHDPRPDMSNPWLSMGPANGEPLWPDEPTRVEDRLLTPTAQRTWYTEDDEDGTEK